MERLEGVKRSLYGSATYGSVLAPAVESAASGVGSSDDLNAQFASGWKPIPR